MKNKYLSKHPLVKCPITGFLVPLNEVVWNGHEFVWYKAYDEYGYKESPRLPEREHPLWRERRLRSK